MNRHPAAIQLTPTELLACWEALRLGEAPVLFRLRRPGWTPAERAEADGLLREAMAGLAQRGLSDGSRPAPVLVGLLRVIAHADYHLDIRYANQSGTGRPVLGIGAVAGAQGAIVLSHDGAGPIRLRPLDGSRVAGALLDLLGPITPGEGTPVNIPADTLDTAASRLAKGDGFAALTDELRALGVDRQAANSLARMCSGILGGGQLGATARYGGPERRAPWVIGFHRTGSGHFMLLRKAGTVTVAPTDPPRLAHQWRELTDALHTAPDLRVLA